ncbi:DUF7316 family protein [Rhodococcus sp. NPDC003994]
MKKNQAIDRSHAYSETITQFGIRFPDGTVKWDRISVDNMVVELDARTGSTPYGYERLRNLILARLHTNNLGAELLKVHHLVKRDVVVTAPEAEFVHTFEVPA